jgi:hypothetical protein
MSTIKASRPGSREASSPQNGQPETVPYVYRQQRGTSYAARIARRNIEASGLLSSRLAPFAEPDALGGPPWPRFGELGGPVGKSS